MRSHPLVIRLLVTAIALVAPLSAAHAIPTDYLYSFGSQGTGDGQFSGPTRIAIGDSGAVYVLDYGNQRIEKFNANGQFLAKAGTGRPFTNPLAGIAVGPDGLVHVVQISAVQTFDANLNYLYFWFVPINNTVTIEISMGPANTICIASSHFASSLNKYTATGTPIGPFQGLMFSAPTDVPGFQVDTDGDVFYISTRDQTVPRQIWKKTSAGVAITQWPSQANNLGFDGLGNLYATDAIAKQVHIYDNNGGFIGEFGTAGTAPGQFNNPTDVAVAPDGRIYVVDQANNRVDVFGPGATPARQTTWGRIKADYR